MTPISKSFRLDDDLIERANREDNFSSMANQAIRDYYNQWTWVPNYKIEEHAGISASKLAERVKGIEYLRSGPDALTFTLYPTNKDEIARNKNIHAYANGEYNALHDGFVYFNVKFPVSFLLFLKSRKWPEVEKAIHGFLAILYIMDEEGQSILESQLERSTFKAVVKLLETPSLKKFAASREKMEDDHGKAIAARDDLHFKAMIDLGIDPMIFPYVHQILGYSLFPFTLTDHIRRANKDFDIKLPAGYMRDLYDEKDDWQSIVVKGDRENENLHRAESAREPWASWIKCFASYHSIPKMASSIRSFSKEIKSIK